MIKIKALCVVFMFLLSCSVNAEEQVIVVKKGDTASLLEAIDQANKQNADSLSERIYILIPDGLYDLKTTVLTTIKGHNISLVGQSMYFTIIRNAPPIEKEGIYKTATILNTGSGLYMQDLTIQNDLNYYQAGETGRAVAFQDEGTRTICNHVRLMSYQATYYTDNALGQSYLYCSEIHGTVDFICGDGDAFFELCSLVTERRSSDGSGCNVIAAPCTSQTKWGYVFMNCDIYNRESEFQYARGWQGTPRCVWLNTRLMTPEKLKEPRFEPKGIGTIQNYFKEYNTKSADGEIITPNSNVVTFTLKGEENAVETILTKQEAKQYQLNNIFPDWKPRNIVFKLADKAVKLRKQNL
jgi:pectin methylesterase-like acyl-CoA thioesterase